jgi:DNA polymerase-3 subunit epsilon
MILAIDSETTGLPLWDRPSEHPGQPHLVQLAMILLDDDLNEQAHASMLIQPNGWEISPEIAEMTGVSMGRATHFGIPEKIAARMFASLAYRGEPLIVGHNISFDLRILRIALLRSGIEKTWLDERPRKTFCTMEESTHIVNLPPTERMLAKGIVKPKPPKLTEAYQHFFGEPLEGAHDALVDVRAALRIYRRLKVADTFDVI